MKKLIYSFMIGTTMLVAASCGYDKTNSGIALGNLDTTANPADNFYQYACGGWMAANPLKPEHSRFGTFDALREQSQEQVKEIINDVSKQKNADGTVAQKIGDLYALAMDSARLNAEGAKTILPQLAKIEAVKDKSELTPLLVELFRNGISPFFSFYVYADDMNSTMNIFHLNQGGYNMGDRDYYFDTDEKTQNIREKYVEFIEKIFVLSGYSAEQAKEASAAVIKIETRLAKVASTRVELRDPVANYHKIAVEDLEKRSPAIQWKLFFQNIGINNISELNLAQLKPIEEVSKIIENEELATIKYYLLADVINNAAAYLSDEFSAANFEFYGKTLSGKEQQRDRWKRAVDVINGTLGEAVGQLYVEKYFPPKAKEKMVQLVRNLQVALGQRIDGLEWMSAETKIKAHEKLATFHVKIGYPDKWRNYSALKINKEKSYMENLVAANNFEFDYNISKFGTEVDKDEWLMNPQTVNAYYNPATNEICFPAAILQPPFFNFDADDAVNYGAIGVVIGHEMTHGFDDQGRQFDKDGNLKDWWVEQDAVRFKERAQVMVDFFDNIVVLDTIHANGSLTLGENIADNGGLQVSWQAYQNTLAGKKAPVKIDGFTDAQRFFLAYATVWASNIRDAEILRLTKIDPHALGRYRVNGALPQIEAWYEAFGIKEGDKMFVPKEKRVAIW